jgi:hypothetical protein
MSNFLLVFATQRITKVPIQPILGKIRFLGVLPVAQLLLTLFPHLFLSNTNLDVGRNVEEYQK